MKKGIIKLLIILISLIIFVSCSTENITDKKIANEVKHNSEGYNLPLIIIDTNEAKINTTYITATMKIYDNDDKLNYLQDKPKLISNIGIKIRGKSSRTYPKKQYSVELRDEIGNEVDKSLLDMSKDSDWVLHGPFEDKSLIRNYMAYTLSGKIMPYAPRCKFCEVFIIDDGKDQVESKHFKGLYLLVEKIKRGKKRVDIFPSQDNKGETSFIVIKDVPNEDDIVFTTYGKETYIYTYDMISAYPKSKITQSQLEYMTKTISKIERVLYSDKYDVIGEGYNQYIDVDTFVDYLIINEFFKNPDIGIYSTYMYKDYGDKIKAGPVWDFNESMGNDNEVSDYNDYTGFYICHNFWFERLMHDKSFVSKVIKRYQVLRKTYLSDEYLLEFIDQSVEMLGDAVKRNFVVWPIDLCNQAESFEGNAIEIFEPYIHDPKLLQEYLNKNKYLKVSTEGRALTHDEEIQQVKTFIVDRGAWIDKNIKSLYKWTD